MMEPERHIYTVSELTKNVKDVLEEAFPFIWITGEISNFKIPSSGHFYFTLKDKDAQIGAIMFRGQSRGLAFRPEDGMAVLAMGRLNVYEPKGTYQIIVEYLEPSGVGALQRAFEQLKEKLSKEGLFDDQRKRALPFLPRLIAVVTSPTGAAVRDILHVIDRRFPTVHVQIVPVRVQGDGAAQDIVEALRIVNQQGNADVIILARGGGSLEDLQAFNHEDVARAVFASAIPVVSAVGHETDFTICDFVADKRAPTPSAAAEIVVPEKTEVFHRLKQARSRLVAQMGHRTRILGERIADLARRLPSPRGRIVDARLRLDEVWLRGGRAATVRVSQARQRLTMTETRLWAQSPDKQAEKFKMALEQCQLRLSFKIQNLVSMRKRSFQVTTGRLNALSPLRVLERGYSVAWTLPDMRLIKDVAQVSVGHQISVNVWRGEMICRVEEKKRNGKTDV